MHYSKVEFGLFIPMPFGLSNNLITHASGEITFLGYQIKGMTFLKTLTTAADQR